MGLSTILVLLAAGVPGGDATLWIAIWIGVGLLDLLAIADIWGSRLSRGAKILWSVLIVFLVGLGPVTWLLTRRSAYQVIEEPPPGQDEPPAEGEPLPPEEVPSPQESR